MYYRKIKNGYLIQIHSANDIWYIWNVLEKNDKIFVETYRIVEEFNEKKKVKLVLEIEKLKYLKDFKSLRITGKIIEGEPSEYVQIGKYHGFDITEQSEFILMKEQLEKYKIDLLNEAVKRSKDLIGNIVLIDERKVMIANLYPIGVEIIFEKDIPFSKMENQNREKFYGEIQEYLKSDKIIVAGPGFEKENLSKFLNKKVSLYDIGYVETVGIKELFQKAKKEIEAERLAKEQQEIERLLSNTDRLVYGDIKEYAEQGRIEKVYIIDEMMEDSEIRKILKTIEEYGGEIHIVSSNSPFSELFYRIKIFGLLRY